MGLPIRPQLRGTWPALPIESRHCNGLHEVPVEASKMIMRKPHVFWFLLAELAAVAVFVQSCPQGASATAQSTAPQIKVETPVVLVDVVVTGAKGDPVFNLKKDEFRIAEDGYPQTISSFEEHKLDHSESVVLPTMPPNVYTNFPTAKSPDSVNVLLLDMLNTQPSSQSYVREQAVNYLSGAPHGTRIAIFALHKNLRLIAASLATFRALRPRSTIELSVPARKSLPYYQPSQNRPAKTKFYAQ
jgi:hypothetical protein